MSTHDQALLDLIFAAPATLAPATPPQCAATAQPPPLSDTEKVLVAQEARAVALAERGEVQV